jgi:DNA-binding transcriptional MerR regulator
MTATNRVQIPDRLYFRIGDVAELVGVKPYVLRYWESEFPMISPQKSPSGQRVYRRNDVETVLMIKHLLYEERYSIEGARKRVRELRKGGELKVLKEEVLRSPEDKMPALTATPEPSIERRMELQSLAHEIRVLVRTPISKLFFY